MSRLCLGTAQFGMDYGITNKIGRVSRDEVGEILAYARAAGVDSLDTAMAYGESESILGSVGVSEFRVVTKLPALPTEIINVKDWVHVQVRGSLSRLRVEHVHGLLLHRATDLIGGSGEALMEAMLRLKDEGLVCAIGVSVYGPDLIRDLDLASVDLVQAPLSVFDRRLESSGMLARLKENDIEVHTRSIFLQGVALMDPQSVPPHLLGLKPTIERFHAWAGEMGESPVAAALAHVLATPGVDRVIVGTDSLSQFEEIIAAEGGRAGAAPGYLGVDDLTLIDPSRWT